MRLTEPDIKVRTTKENVIYLVNYLQHCVELQVVDSYTNPFFKSLVSFSLQTLTEKLMKLAFKTMQDKADKALAFKVNQAERVTMSILFLRVPVSPELQSIETQILNRLIV